MKKMINSAKANLNAIQNIIDLSLGGTISQIKANMTSVYSGYLDEKLNSLIIDVLNNQIKEEELNKFIENLHELEKNLLYVVIKKSLDSKDKIVIFILANVLAKKIKNNELNYYEESLVSNIDTLTEFDFKNYINIIDNLTQKDEGFNIKLKTDEDEISMLKFINIGIIKENRENLIVLNKDINILKTSYSDEFYDILKKYYD